MDQPGRGGGRGSFSSGELVGGFGVLSSIHIAFKHAVGLTVSGQKPYLNPWTKDAQIHAKPAIIWELSYRNRHSKFPEWIQIQRTSILYLGGLAPKTCRGMRSHGVSCSRLSNARAIRMYGTYVLRRGRHGTLSFCGTALKQVGPNRTSPNAFIVFKIAPGNHPLDETGMAEDLTADVRRTGLALGNYVLYTICVDALPDVYEIEARTLETRDIIDREIIKAMREGHHILSGRRKEGSNSGHAVHAGDGGDHGKGGVHGNGKGGREGKHGRGGRCANEEGIGSVAAAGGDDSSVKVTQGSAPVTGCYRCGMEGDIEALCTDTLRNRCHG